MREVLRREVFRLNLDNPDGNKKDKDNIRNNIETINLEKVESIIAELQHGVDFKIRSIQIIINFTISGSGYTDPICSQ